VRERPNGDDARRYRSAKQNQALYRASAFLWQKGVAMSEAIQIVSNAMAESAGRG